MDDTLYTQSSANRYCTEAENKQLAQNLVQETKRLILDRLASKGYSQSTIKILEAVLQSQTSMIATSVYHALGVLNVSTDQVPAWVADKVCQLVGILS